METAAVTASRYLFDPRLSRFTVRAYASGMLSAFGHNPNIAIRDFRAEVRLTPDDISSAELEITVDAASLQVADNLSEKDRREIERTMKAEVLETARYPDIVFASSSISPAKRGEGQYSVIVAGSLSLHGVARSQPILARVALLGDALRAYGEFSLRQSDYNIKRVSVAGGGLKVKDELKFSFDLVARKQE